MNKIKWLLVLSLLFNFTFISIASFVLYKKGGIEFLKDQIQAATSVQEYPNYYLQKKDIFESVKTINVDKVFIGDSITDHGEFQEYFSNEVVLNRGISNDNSKGVLNRIDEVVKRKPKRVYIMIGVNDILYKTDLKDYAKNINAIVKSFDLNTKVTLLSILPVNNEIYGSAVSNDLVKTFNKELKSIARENNISFVDLHDSFLDESGQLKKDYTIDGIHLNGEGYRVWINAISE